MNGRSGFPATIDGIGRVYDFQGNARYAGSMESFEKSDHNDEVGSDAGSSRSRPRASLFIAGRISVDRTGQSQDIRIRNLSAIGMMAECGLRVVEGDAVAIDFKTIGRVPGTVAWIREGKLGIRFDYEIDPDEARTPVKGAVASVPDYLKKLGKPVSPLRRV
jgi:hypothetical protein